MSWRISFEDQKCSEICSVIVWKSRSQNDRRVERAQMGEHVFYSSDQKWHFETRPNIPYGSNEILRTIAEHRWEKEASVIFWSFPSIDRLSDGRIVWRVFVKQFQHRSGWERDCSLQCWCHRVSSDGWRWNASRRESLEHTYCSIRDRLTRRRRRDRVTYRWAAMMMFSPDEEKDKDQLFGWRLTWAWPPSQTKFAFVQCNAQMSSEETREKERRKWCHNRTSRASTDRYWNDNHLTSRDEHNSCTFQRYICAVCRKENIDRDCQETTISESDRTIGRVTERRKKMISSVTHRCLDPIRWGWGCRMAGSLLNSSIFCVH